MIAARYCEDTKMSNFNYTGVCLGGLLLLAFGVRAAEGGDWMFNPQNEPLVHAVRWLQWILPTCTVISYVAVALTS